MRQIVVGQIVKERGIQSITVWFRFSVPAARQAYYAAQQKSFQPAAPGDYTNPGGADAAEVAAFQAGQWVERDGFMDVINPADSLATIQARLQQLWAAASAQASSDDTAALARWGSGWDGTAWSMKSS